MVMRRRFVLPDDGGGGDMRAAAAADMGAALAAAIVASHDYKQRGLRQATGIMAATQAANMRPIVVAVALHDSICAGANCLVVTLENILHVLPKVCVLE